MDKVRRAVFDSLLRLENEDKYANLELSATLAREQFDETDRAFYTHLFYGVIERQIALDLLIDAFSRDRRSKIERKVRILLRMGLYQLLYLDSVPDHAAVSETVELSKKVCHAGVSGFINGILRTAIRQRHSLPLPPEGSDERLAAESGCPIWLCRLWKEQYGAERAESLVLAANRISPLTLRVNTLKITREDLLARLAQEGISAQPTSVPGGIRLLGAYPIADLQVLTEGLCFVQDEASQICARALGALPGERVLDVCACPGGKSFSIAIEMQNRGQLISRDLHKSKLSLVSDGARRLGISILQAEERDGRLPPSKDEAPFDRILCDVPCSGLGVISKKPDLRFKNPQDLARLPEIQGAILASASQALRPGGYLIYSTCTLNRAENEAVVSQFLSAHPEFALTAEGMPQGKSSLTFFPDEGETDGFFIAKFQKASL